MKLWTEFYRPDKLADYVWVDEEMRRTVEGWLAEKALPHALFSGGPGSGKTTLAKMLFKLLEIPSADLLYINASRERQIDAFQDRVVNFVDSWAMGPTGIKYILLDEADKMSPTAQGLLRNEIETYSDVTRWIMTCNYPAKIIPAIHSRVQELKFPSLNKEEFMLRLAEILDRENVSFEPETLILYIEQCFPDLRKSINLLQQNSRDGQLNPPRADDTGTKDYLLTTIDLFKQGRFTEARKLIVAQIQAEEYDDVYRLLYEHVHLFAKTEEQETEALLAIRKGLVNHAIVADGEINLSATLCELVQIAKT